MQIWEYALQEGFVDQEIEMPIGAKVLAVQEQGGRICVWAQVDECLTEQERESRKFSVIPTGRDLPHRMSLGSYHGTVQIGPLVWHVFSDEFWRLEQGVSL